MTDAPTRKLYEWRGDPSRSLAAESGFAAPIATAATSPVMSLTGVRVCALCGDRAERVVGGWWCEACGTATA